MDYALVSGRDLALIKKACEKILAEPDEFISEGEAARILGKEGKPLKSGTMDNYRRLGTIPRSCYTRAVNGKFLYNKQKLMGLE